MNLGNSTTLVQKFKFDIVKPYHVKLGIFPKGNEALSKLFDLLGGKTEEVTISLQSVVVSKCRKCKREFPVTEIHGGICETCDHVAMDR
jgi:hypothetical protein